VIQRGTPVLVLDDGQWKPATYEFRVKQGMPAGHHSVMLADGSGRCLVSPTKLRTEAGLPFVG
jgi:hypothetical protein